MTPLIAVITLLLLAATVAPLSRSGHWLVRGMDFPRVQLSVVAVLLLMAQLGWLDRANSIFWPAIGITSLCLIWQLWWILPYTPLWPSEVDASINDDPDLKLRILTANVLTSNRQAEKFLELVRRSRPDVLVTLESDPWWERHLDTLETEMPHTVKCPLDNLYGMHVYSRLPLEEASISYLVEEDIPSIHAVIAMRSGDRVRAHFLHPAPPSPTQNADSGKRDAELIVVARSVMECDRPLIVTGDLNDVAWSATTRLFRKLSGLLDPRVGRGMFNTFHAGYPFMRWPLDHLFHSGHFTLDSIERLEAFGSDHFALLTELSLTPALGATQEGSAPEPGDRSWARAISDAQGVIPADVPEPG